MVRVPNPGNLRAGGDAAGDKAVAVKLEIEDALEEEHGPLNKRSKHAASLHQWCGGASTLSSPPVHYNPLDEPSPLGLRLRKSPSLLELIQMKLSQPNLGGASCVTSSGGLDAGKKKELKSTAVSNTIDKMKASNFPASLLKIGAWERVSKYEGDLVAKCYFAKHKLVWEVLEGGLKSKIEIQWSDITALKASCPENVPGTLDIVLARQPLFFRETNPQPRKHTLWQATSDFTGRQASIHRRHFVQCPPGLLSKHFEKLIQCDPRLKALSRQPDIILENPYFEPRCSIFEDPTESKCQDFEDLKEEYSSTFSGYREPGSPAASSISSRPEVRDTVAMASDLVGRRTPSPSSVMDRRATEESISNANEEFIDLRRWEQFKIPGLRPSMSKADLVNHLENCISEQMASGNPVDGPNKDMLEELTQYLLSDSHIFSSSDELSLMSRVNSLCCLIQKDSSTPQNPQINSNHGGSDNEPHKLASDSASDRKPVLEFPGTEGELNDASSCKQPTGMSRKESFGELLMHLPRIASMPQFLLDPDNQAR